MTWLQLFESTTKLVQDLSRFYLLQPCNYLLVSIRRRSTDATRSTGAVFLKWKGDELPVVRFFLIMIGHQRMQKWSKEKWTPFECDFWLITSFFFFENTATTAAYLVVMFKAQCYLLMLIFLTTLCDIVTWHPWHASSLHYRTCSYCYMETFFP